MCKRLVLTIVAVLVLMPMLASCRRPTATLPDSAYAHAVFVPDGKTVLVVTESPPFKLYAFDLTRKAITATRETRARAGVSLSANGAYVLLGERHRDDMQVQLSVLRLGDLSPLFQKEIAHQETHNPDAYTQDTGRRLRVSDDGAWAALGLQGGTLEIYDVARRVLAYRESVPGVICQVAFEPNGKRLTVYWGTFNGTTVAVLEPTGGKWATVATLDQARWPSWIDGGVGFVTERGIEIWDGRQRTVIPKASPDETPTAYDVAPTAVLAGAYAVLQTSAGLDAYDLKARKRILSRSMERAPGRDVTCGTAKGALARGRLRAFLCTGRFVDIDLTTGAVAQERSFGKPGRYRKNWFGQEGAGWVSYYWPTLSPDGRFVSLYREGQSHAIYALE